MDARFSYIEQKIDRTKSEMVEIVNMFPLAFFK